MRGKYDVIVFQKYVINNYSFTLLSFNLVPRVKNRFAYTLAKWGFCNKVNGSILPWALPAFICAFVKLLRWMGQVLCAFFDERKKTMYFIFFFFFLMNMYFLILDE